MTRLISTVICDDVMENAAGRLSLYAIFRDLWADKYPASVVRLHVVNTWFNAGDTNREIVERVAIVSPDGETIVGEAAGTLVVLAGKYYTQINRFRSLVFPTPGVYRVQVQQDSELLRDIPLLLEGPSDTEPTDTGSPLTEEEGEAYA